MRFAKLLDGGGDLDAMRDAYQQLEGGAFKIAESMYGAVDEPTTEKESDATDWLGGLARKENERSPDGHARPSQASSARPSPKSTTSKRSSVKAASASSTGRCTDLEAAGRHQVLQGADERAPDIREGLLKDFIQEGALLTQLSGRTASIVQARDVGTFTTAGGAWVPYMVLEWLEGRPLESMLEDERAGVGNAAWPMPKVIALLEPVAIGARGRAPPGHRPPRHQAREHLRLGAATRRGASRSSTSASPRWCRTRSRARLVRQDRRAHHLVHAGVRRARAVQPHPGRDRPVDRRVRARARPGRGAPRRPSPRSTAPTSFSSAWRPPIRIAGPRRGHSVW